MDLCFTIVIKCENGYQVSYQLAYQPCPVWMQEDKYVVNMCDDGVHYKKGAFGKLLEFHKKDHGRVIHIDKQCLLISDKKWTENAGYDSNDTLNRIVEDIESEGFRVTIIQF